MMETENPIILFDGICNLCNSAVNFILKRDKKKQFQLVSLQSEQGVELMHQYQIPKETDSIVFIAEKQIFIESDAALKIARLLPVPWNWLIVFKVIPKKIRDKIYQWIARNRYRWFGKRDVCRMI